MAQQLQCTVLKKDTQRPLDGIVVRAFTADGTMSTYTSTDEKGHFTIDTEKLKLIKVAGLGYIPQTITIHTLKNNPKIYLSTSSTRLREVVVKSNRLQERGDTLAYSVAGFAQKQDRSIADVLKKMPGIEVKENGAIEYNGTAINKFYIEGMDLMNNRYALASNNLNRKKVKTVEVLRNHQPIAALRGKTFSEQAAINLVLTDNAKLNLTGSADLGGGYGQGKKEALYDGRLIGMLFKKRTQNFTLYKANNTGADIMAEVTPQMLEERTRETDMEAGIISELTPSAGDFPKERFLFNQSHLVATNHLQRIGKNATLRFQASYYHDVSQSEHETITDYLISTDKPIQVTESYQDKVRRNNADVNLAFEHNGDKLYIKENLQASMKWAYGTGNAYINGHPTTVWSRPDQRYFLHNFQLTLPSTQGNTVSILSSLSYDDMPQRLNTLVLDKAGVRYKSIHSYNELTIYNRLLGLNFKHNIGFEYHRQSMHTTENGKETGQGKLNQVLPFATSNVYIEREGLRVEGNVKLRWWNIHGEAGDLSALVPEAGLNTRYEFNGMSKVSLRYDYSSSYPSLQALYGNKLYTAFRTVTVSKTALKRAPAHSFNFHYEYTQPLKGLFFSLNTLYQIRRMNAVLQGRIDDNALYVTTYKIAHFNRHSLNTGFRLSESFPWWRAVLALSGNYADTRDKRMYHDQLTDIRQHTVFGDLSFSASPAQWLSLELASSALYSQMNGGGLKKRTSNLKHRAGLCFSFTKNLLLKWNNSLSQYPELHKNAFFSDLAVNYTFKRVELSLTAHNIFDTDTYQQDLVTADYHIINRYTLRSRDILGTVSFNF